MSTPAAFYNNAVDLNRYSNKVARQIVTTYNDVIVSAVEQLRGLDDQTAPIRATRLRAILGQLKGSLDGWAGDATALAVGELQGLAELQGEFVQEQLQELMNDVLDPENLDLAVQIRNVQISPNFAQSVAVTDPTAINVVTLSDDLQQAVRGNFQASFRLDAAKGATITLPNGKVLEKSFRGIATSNTEIFARNVRVGLLEGQSIERISRGLRGRVRFGQTGSVAQIQRMGGDATKMANHQLLTLVRTSVNQVANATAQANYQANQEVTKKYKYVATLDGRTSPICRSLDGKEFAYNDGPTPPQHFNCRSTTVPIIDYKGLGVSQPPPDRRKARNAKDGLIPGDQTYGDWLAGQSKKTKAEILGSERRAEIFDSFTKKVGPKEAIRKFVRDDGSELDLGDLERRLKRTKAKPATSATPKPKPKPKPAAKAQPKVSPVEYIREHQHDNGKNKLSHKAIADSLELAGNEKGLAGENMRKMLQFQQKKEIQTIWSTGREKLFGPDFDHWGDTEIIKALRAGNGKGEGVARAIADDLEKGRKNPLLSKIGKVSSGAAGHTMEGANFIVLKQEGQFKQITAKSISRIKNAAANSVLDAKAGRPQKVVTAQLYKKTGKTTWKTEDGWLGTYVHEMGHQVHFKAGKPSLGRIIEEGLEDLSGEKLLVERAKRRWKPSVYGGTNEMEQFAETFVQFVFAPDELRKANPYAYRWVAEAMEAALK